jgi:hypothetical protein
MLVLVRSPQVLVKQPATFASCCVGINGLDRHVYLLPRETNLETGEPVTAMALLSELKETMIRVVPPGKGQYRTRKVTKNYAFEMPNVPREETTYIELVYGFKFPPLPTDFSGKTFSRCAQCCAAALRLCTHVTACLTAEYLARALPRWRLYCCIKTSWALAGLRSRT